MRQTLTVEQREGTTFVHWRRVTIADIVAFFALPMAAAWGVASALGWEELGEMKVVELNSTATAIFWFVLGLLALHLIFNRIAVLTVTPQTLTYQVGRVPGRVRTIERATELRLSIHTREDPIAESDAAGRSSTKTTLSIVGAVDQRIEIDDLSEDNAERLKRLLAESTAQPGT